MVRRPMADGLDRRAAPGRHTHRAAQPRPGPARPVRARSGQQPQAGPSRPGRPGRGRPGLRRVSAVALVMLVLQYGLGMILSFYVGIPAADAHAGIFTEIATAPLALTAHALLGAGLAGTAILAVARAMRLGERLLAVLAAAGLAAIVGAFVAGEMFVKNGEDGTSFAMAMLTGAALLCYLATLILTSGPRPDLEQQTEPLLVSVPAARPEDPVEYLDDGWGAEPGWDDDPSWAERLRQDQDPGWPGQPRWPHREQQAGREQRAPWDQQAGREQRPAGSPDYRPDWRPDDQPDWRRRPSGPNWRL
jgi:hypothetical protein